MLQRARRHQDLYDLAALQEMELTYPWLQVIPAMSDEPAHDHDIMYGTIPELAAKATWAERDIYISGPDHMIVKTARVLRERGTSSAVRAASSRRGCAAPIGSRPP